MTKTMGRLVLGVMLGASAVGGWTGCGSDKVAGLHPGTGGAGGSTLGSGGAPGQTSATGLQFNGAITFVRVAR